MIKLFLIGLVMFGAFMAMALYLPTHVWKTAFEVGGRNIPWIALGVVGCGYIGYKAIK